MDEKSMTFPERMIDQFIKSWPVLIAVGLGIIHANSRLDHAEWEVQNLKNLMIETRSDVKGLRDDFIVHRNAVSAGKELK